MEPEEKEDNVRIYIPVDLNREAILRRLDSVIYHYPDTYDFVYDEDHFYKGTHGIKEYE